MARCILDGLANPRATRQTRLRKPPISFGYLTLPPAPTDYTPDNEIDDLKDRSSPLKLLCRRGEYAATPAPFDPEAVSPVDSQTSEWSEFIGETRRKAPGHEYIDSPDSDGSSLASGYQAPRSMRMRRRSSQNHRSSYMIHLPVYLRLHLLLHQNPNQ
jgi:hypothetical protein